LSQYREWELGALAVAGLAQFIVTLWSVISRWDEELAYASRAARDSYELKTAWVRIGKGEADDPEVSYRVTSEQQRIIDSHDIEKDFTDAERRYGMRSALFERQVECNVCQQKPKSTRIPWFVWHRCGSCGGKMRNP
jgi:mobilome CxxCx(11)CxxC protein